MVKIYSSNHPINRHRWSFAQEIADRLAGFAGSWEFILFIVFLILTWTLVNAYILIERRFDPYPFVFLNLVLAIITSILTPVILMSQNRASQRDRVRAEYDYELNKKSEKEIQEIKRQLDRIERKLR
jgi:uncharacterized membrane protein